MPISRFRSESFSFLFQDPDQQLIPGNSEFSFSFLLLGGNILSIGTLPRKRQFEKIIS